ncbi:hypothetical protein [Polaromonas sp. CG9_12]|nr:hypothetical protein [Polaromonas sp. CG9_12]
MDVQIGDGFGIVGRKVAASLKRVSHVFFSLIPCPLRLWRMNRKLHPRDAEGFVHG